MALDWIRLFQDHNIHYVTSGKNVSKGYIGFKCPLCGENDPSTHGGVHLNTGRWSCWRDASHRGASPDYLISALLGVSKVQARLIAQGYSGASVDDFGLSVGTTSTPEGIQKPVELLPDFIDIKANSLTHKFWVYLQNRGFDDPDQVIQDYHLKCCLTDRWKGRLIIPVYGTRSSTVEPAAHNRSVEGSNPSGFTIIGWQGRSLRTLENVPRYLTSSEAVKKTLFNLQNISNGGETLQVWEGPFDAIKTDYYGKPKIRATCLFGATPTPEQITSLYELSSKFSQLVLCLDADHTGITNSFALSDWLPNVSFSSLPEGHKDTDKMDATQMYRWLHG